MLYLRELQRKAQQTRDTLPEYLRQDPEDIWLHQRPPIECLYLVFIHIEHLYNEFLLQRALIKRAGTDTRELLQVAVRLLADIIMVAGKREVLREFQDAHLMVSRCQSLRTPSLTTQTSSRALVSLPHVRLQSSCFARNSIHTSPSPFRSTGHRRSRTSASSRTHWHGCRRMNQVPQSAHKGESSSSASWTRYYPRNPMPT